MKLILFHLINMFTTIAYIALIRSCSARPPSLPLAAKRAEKLFLTSLRHRRKEVGQRSVAG